MKKIILCLLAFSFLAFVSCKKEENSPEVVNPAKEFVGDYTISGTLNLNLPTALGGTQQIPVQERELSIALNGNEGDVIITSGQYSVDGYVRNDGLHVDPVVVQYPFMSSNIDLTLTIPTVKKPVNGTTSCIASVVATVSGITITGTADITVTKVQNS